MNHAPRSLESKLFLEKAKRDSGCLGEATLISRSVLTVHQCRHMNPLLPENIINHAWIGSYQLSLNDTIPSGDRNFKIILVVHLSVTLKPVMLLYATTVLKCLKQTFPNDSVILPGYGMSCCVYVFTLPTCCSFYMCYNGFTKWHHGH